MAERSELAGRISKLVGQRGRDFWGRALRGLHPWDNIRGLLPACRAMPDCPEASELVAIGRPAYECLLDIVRSEERCTRRFRNALCLLLYFDSLFVYREFKEAYGQATARQRKWFEAACRKLLIRCVEFPEEGTESLLREIPRNTRQGRLATTRIVIRRARDLLRQRRRRVLLRDMAVADGITTLDVALEASRKKLPLDIVASDVQVFLRFAESQGGRAVFTSDGKAVQHEIGGRTMRAGDAQLSRDYAAVCRRLDALSTRRGLKRGTMLAPEVEAAVSERRCAISFKEEDVFDPAPDIARADIIRIANLLVERTADHRGYFDREDIVKAIRGIGVRAKDGAYLYVDNFRKKVERVGVWRKDRRAGKWIRQPTPAQLAEALEGVGDIGTEL